MNIKLISIECLYQQFSQVQLKVWAGGKDEVDDGGQE